MAMGARDRYRYLAPYSLPASLTVVRSAVLQYRHGDHVEERRDVLKIPKMPRSRFGYVTYVARLMTFLENESALCGICAESSVVKVYVAIGCAALSWLIYRHS